jgi:hypothetical protein
MPVISRTAAGKIHQPKDTKKPASTGDEKK